MAMMLSGNSGYGRRRGGAGKIIFTLIALLLLGGGGYYLYRSKGKVWLKERKAQKTEEQGVETVAAEGPVYSAEAKALFSAAKQAAEAGELITARDNLYSLIEQELPPAIEDEAIKLLGTVNIELLYSPRNMENKVWHTIEAGDSLAGIASKYNCPVTLIKKINSMTSDMIRRGNRLLVCTGEFSIVASKSKNTLDLLMNKKLQKRYLVGTGKYGKTPVAHFTIVDKIVEPPWTRPTDGKRIEYGDPGNLLGSRWMAIKSEERPELTGFGIHGTWDRESVGKQSSNGCIRMLNEEVEELFDIVPRRTTVTIVE